MKNKPIISEKVSKHLFLPNLKPKNNNKTYLDSLMHKLNFIRNTDITKEMEEKKLK